MKGNTSRSIHQTNLLQPWKDYKKDSQRKGRADTKKYLKISIKLEETAKGYKEVGEPTCGVIGNVPGYPEKE